MLTENLIKKIDVDNMLGKLLGFSNQCSDANLLADKIKVSTPKNILFCGMGGSGIGGDILKKICNTTSKTPFFVNKEYNLPLWADKNTLIIIASYSGNTEETINAFNEGLKLGCQLLCLSNNGEIQKLSLENKIPFIKIPSGYPPRSALGYVLFPCYKILANLKILEDLKPNIFTQIREWVKNFSPNSKNNISIKISKKIYNKMPILYSSHLLSPATFRWRSQIAENSKSFVLTSILPEMNHNEIMAWSYPEWFIKKSVPIFLESQYEHPRTKLRFKITRDIISKIQPETTTIKAEGDSLLSNILYSVILGDWVSYYLAILYKVDPTGIDKINLFKKQLGGKQE